MTKNLLATVKSFFVAAIIIATISYSYAEHNTDKKETKESFFSFLKLDNSTTSQKSKTSFFDFLSFKGNDNPNHPHHSFFGFSTGYSHSLDRKTKGHNSAIQSISSSPTVSALIGKYYNNFLKLQLELNHKFTYKSTSMSNHDTESQDFQSTSLFFNPVFYFPVASLDNTLQTLLITGIGAAYNKSSNRVNLASPDVTTQTGKGRLSLAWQIGTGVVAQINRITAIELLIKYVDRGKASSTTSRTFPSARTQKLQSIDFAVGLTFDIDKK